MFYIMYLYYVLPEELEDVFPLCSFLTNRIMTILLLIVRFYGDTGEK